MHATLHGGYILLELRTARGNSEAEHQPNAYYYGSSDTLHK